ncbi:MAG: RnfABCDGE type electron transport complex subunit D, partial [Bacilli bacterium]|nr:RnfABCDGE type electron transport complex subunit D [Bacilli bacterium]
YADLKPSFGFFNIDHIESGATPLANINNYTFNNINQYGLDKLFFGQVPGTLGEVYCITILLGLIYLLIRRSIDYRIVASYFGSFAFFSLIAGLAIFTINKSINPFHFMLYSLLSGGVLFGGTFMLTDPVTSPINSPSRWMYGVIASMVTIFIRLFAAFPEGVGIGILIANMFAVVLDHYEWSSSRFTWKKTLTLVLLVVLPAIIIYLILAFGGVYHA